MSARNVQRAAAITLYVAFAVAANLLTTRFGLVSVGFGLVAAGTFTAGAALLLRDWVHDTAGVVAVVACIAAGTALSALTAGAQLALASGAAFLVSELADLAVYAPLRRRSLVAGVLASNTVGAVVDSVLFLSLAGFGLSQAAVTGQVAVKLAVTLAVFAPVVVCRALLRDRVRPEGA